MIKLKAMLSENKMKIKRNGTEYEIQYNKRYYLVRKTKYGYSIYNTESDFESRDDNYIDTEATYWGAKERIKEMNE